MENVSWWLERLDEVNQIHDGWEALCPFHDDVKPSLHINETSDGKALIHCFAGCAYNDIFEATNQRGEIPPPSRAAPTVTIVGVISPETWWAEYTNVPWEDWAALGMAADSKNIIFTWRSSKVQKVRRAKSKQFSWFPEGPSRPHLWPEPEDQLPAEIWLTEGESDCGILRYLGFTAFSRTKGADAKPGAALWRNLHNRGVRTIILVPDLDPAGLKGARELSLEIGEGAITPVVLDWTSILNPVLGEKDIRDVWVREGNRDELAQRLQQLAISSPTRQTSHARLDQFMSVSFPPSSWLVEGLWLYQAIGLIVGAPKMGKSWLALDLALSIASGTPFLGTFPTRFQGPVVYITKEDPDYLLYDRLTKVQIAKGLGGKVLPNYNIMFPNHKRLPLYLDLGRRFSFNDEGLGPMLQWLDSIQKESGQIALVVFDPILRMMLGVDEFRATEVAGTVFKVSEQLQREFGTSVALVHHKAKKTTSSRAFYGSIAFHAFSENTLFIQGDEPPKDGWVPVRAEFKSAAPMAWSYNMEELTDKYVISVA